MHFFCCLEGFRRVVFEVFDSDSLLEPIVCEASHLCEFSHGLHYFWDLASKPLCYV